MNAPAKKTRKRKAPKMRKNDSRQPTFGQAMWSAGGAAFGALAGAAFHRDPKGFMELVGQVVKLAGDPSALEAALKEMSRSGEWTIAAAHPSPPQSTSGPFTGDPEGQALYKWVQDQADALRKEHPEWGEGRVSDEVMERAYAAGKIPKPGRVKARAPKSGPRPARAPRSPK